MTQNIPDACDVMQVSVHPESELFDAFHEYVMNVRSQWETPQYWCSHAFQPILDQYLSDIGLSYDRTYYLLSGTTDAVTQWILSYA